MRKTHDKCMITEKNMKSKLAAALAVAVIGGFVISPFTGTHASTVHAAVTPFGACNSSSGRHTVDHNNVSVRTNGGAVYGTVNIRYSYVVNNDCTSYADWVEYQRVSGTFYDYYANGYPGNGEIFNTANNLDLDGTYNPYNDCSLVPSGGYSSPHYFVGVTLGAGTAYNMQGNFAAQSGCPYPYSNVAFGVVPGNY